MIVDVFTVERFEKLESESVRYRITHFPTRKYSDGVCTARNYEFHIKNKMDALMARLREEH